MAVIVRIISADGKKVIARTLPALPTHIKVPEGARIEVVDQEHGTTSSLAKYINEHPNPDASGNPGSAVTIETVQNWEAAETWLNSLVPMGGDSASSSSSAAASGDWYNAGAQDENGKVLGLETNTLWIGGLVGIGAAAGISALASGGPKDNIAPGAPRTLDLATADDNGASTTDNVTTLTSGLTITGLAETGSTVELFDGTTSLGTTTADADGAFSIDVSLADGTHSVTAKSTDKAGNVSTASTALSITVDATAPAAAANIDLAAADDTGSNNADNLTKTTTGLTITGTAEANARVELFDGDTSLGTATVAATGTFSRDITLTEGTHNITVKITDVAGNNGPTSAPLTIVVDTTAPATPGVIDLAADDDTGGSNSDNVTSKTSGLTLTGTGPAGSTIELLDGTKSLGIVTAGTDGTYSLDVSLAAGDHTITARTNDAAGNASDASPALTITIDATAPGTPTSLDFSANDDTGVSSSDNITNRTEGLTITGNAQAGSIVEILDGTTSLGTITSGVSGKFSIDVTLGEGEHSLSAVASDAAGNTSASSAPLTVIVDTTAPSAPTGLDLAAIDDTGTSSSDNITGNTTDLTITGSAAAGSRVELFEGLTSLGTATAAADGSFSVDIDLAVGTHEIFARAMDVAGNVGPSSNEMTITVIDETQLAASLASNSFG